MITDKQIRECLKLLKEHPGRVADFGEMLEELCPGEMDALLRYRGQTSKAIKSLRKYEASLNGRSS